MIDKEKLIFIELVISRILAEDRDEYLYAFISSLIYISFILNSDQHDCFETLHYYMSTNISCFKKGYLQRMYGDHLTFCVGKILFGTKEQSTQALHIFLQQVLKASIKIEPDRIMYLLNRIYKLC